MYCQVSDVEQYFMNKEFSSTTYLQNQEVAAFIAQEGAIINATIKTRYTLPITDSDDLNILKTIQERLVAGTLDGLFREKDPEGRFDRSRNLRKEALDLLKQIKEGELLLSDNEKDSTIKFNKLGADGVEVEKRFKDSNIQPTSTTYDRDRKTVTRLG